VRPGTQELSAIARREPKLLQENGHGHGKPAASSDWDPGARGVLGGNRWQLELKTLKGRKNVDSIPLMVNNTARKTQAMTGKEEND